MAARRTESQGEPHLHLYVYVVGALLLVGVAWAVYQFPTFLLGLVPWPTFSVPTSEEATPPLTLSLDERYTSKPTTYGLPQPETKPREPIPTAVPVARAVPPAVVIPPPVAAPAPASPVQAQVQPTPDWLKLFDDRDRREQERQDRQEEFVRRMMQQQQQPRQGQPPPQPQGEKPKERTKTVKAMGKPMLSAEQQKEDPTMSEEARAKQARDKAAEGLIQNATWARPSQPLKTLYRSQSLAGKTLDAINSDIPGQLRIVLTVPVFDKFGQGEEIIPKDSIVIAKQASGAAQYGQTRLNITVEQLEFPTGEVIKLKSTVGDSEGASGVSGKVNAHLGKLLLATGISAVLNIGVQTAAGTPGRGQYFESPIQSAAGDATRDIQQSAKGVVDRTLRIPPTITVKPGAFCTIALEENVMFAHAPTVVK